MPEHFDVIVIGSGAGGGTLAHALAPTGKRILILERGGYLPREKDNWSSHAVFVDGKYKAKESWRDKDGKPFQPSIHYYVGSFFPSSAAVNPTLTIIANALRVADHLTERLGH